MRVFSVPLSAPLLRTVVAALIDGRLVDGFEARGHPVRLAEAALYLPTRRAGRMPRQLSVRRERCPAPCVRRAGSANRASPPPVFLEARGPRSRRQACHRSARRRRCATTALIGER